jgi:hypothetical protein
MPVGEERKRSHTLAAGAKGLLKTPRFFHKDGREKRSNLPRTSYPAFRDHVCVPLAETCPILTPCGSSLVAEGDSEPIISFRPSLDEGRHRRTNSTDVSFRTSNL